MNKVALFSSVILYNNQSQTICLLTSVICKTTLITLTWMISSLKSRKVLKKMIVSSRSPTWFHDRLLKISHGLWTVKTLMTSLPPSYSHKQITIEWPRIVWNLHKRNSFQTILPPSANTLIVDNSHRLQRKRVGRWH